jgi:hypothetical protein
VPILLSLRHLDATSFCRSVWRTAMVGRELSL